MEFPVRKHTRIPGYNYASYNFYFVTICTHNRKCIFGEPDAPNFCGKIAEECLLTISDYYPQVTVDKWVVMPNHVHVILIIGNERCAGNLPNLSQVVGQYKMTVTKRIRKQYPDQIVWQKSFHDHIIRDRKGYEKIWGYIQNNPQKWEEDCFYPKE